MRASGRIVAPEELTALGIGVGDRSEVVTIRAEIAFRAYHLHSVAAFAIADQHDVSAAGRGVVAEDDLDVVVALRKKGIKRGIEQ